MSLLTVYVKKIERSAVLKQLLSALEPYLPSDALPEAKKLIYRHQNITVTVSQEVLQEAEQELLDLLQATQEEMKEFEGEQTGPKKIGAVQTSTS